MKFSVYFFLVAFSVSKVSAITISKIKGKKVLINLDGAVIEVGQLFKVVDANVKTVGILKILNISKEKAIAEIIKGNVNESDKIVTPQSNLAVGQSTKTTPNVPRNPYYGSLLLGLASNIVSIKVSDGIKNEKVDNTGNSVGLGVAVDHQYFKPWFRGRAVLAYEQFNAIGAASINGCNNQTSRDCQTDIKYLSGGMYAKFVQDYAQFQLWGGAGLNLKIPFSKSSTALVESSLGPTVAYGFILGSDYLLESKNFVTASIEKQFFLKSDSAETSTLFVRVGVGKQF